MPFVGFKPTKARLVIEQSKDSVLVMKVAAAPDERLVLGSGETLSSLQGVLRIREHRPHRDRLERRVSGTMVYVEGAGPRSDGSARFQINLGMAKAKFDALLQVALAGHLPTKFFVEAGERSRPFGRGGIHYELANGARRKVWDVRNHPVLDISDFSMILPVDVPDEGMPVERYETVPAGDHATSSQVAELADELLAFQAETHHTLKAIVTVIGVILLLAVVFNVVLLFR